MRPEASEVHISVTFTWDIKEGERLQQAWGQHYPKVKIGGCAFDDPGEEFIPGRYIKPGITFTSRGCNFECPPCLAWRREGRIRELDFAEGNVVQDNNLLLCRRSHVEKVLAMLRKQRKVSFKGGLDARLLSDWFVDSLRTLQLDEVFFACDYEEALKPLRKALSKLKWLGKDKNGLLKHIYCYVLLAYNGQTIKEAEDLLRSVSEAGAMPFAQLYQPSAKRIEYPVEWRRLARTWSRPAITKAHMRASGCDKDD